MKIDFDTKDLGPLTVENFKSPPGLRLDRLTESCLEAGKVYYVDEVTIVRDRPENIALLAGTCTINRTPISITFHYGRNMWCVCDTRQPLRFNYSFDTLPRCVAEFERLTGVGLPPIRVVQHGVGLWEAHTDVITENPWLLLPGEDYEVTKDGNAQRYRVTERGNVYRVFDNPDETIPSESYNPKVIWNVQQWQSLKKVEKPELDAAPARRMRP